jgi:hypothetical protein
MEKKKTRVTTRECPGLTYKACYEFGKDAQCHGCKNLINNEEGRIQYAFYTSKKNMWLSKKIFHCNAVCLKKMKIDEKKKLSMKKWAQRS